MMEVIGVRGSFRFVVISETTLDGELCQAVITNNRLGWTKEVGYETESFLEASNELKFYMERGFNFDGVQYKPKRMGAIAN